LFEFSLPAVLEFSSPRAWAYTLLGIQEYLTSYPGDRDAQKIRSALSRRLLEMYESIRRPEWKWFENVLAYGNARLPQALLLAGAACSDDRMISAGLGASYNTYGDYELLQAAIKDRQAKLKDQTDAKDLIEALGKLQTAAAAIAEGKSDAPGIGTLNRDTSRYLVMVESADMRPPVSAQTAAVEACKKLQVNLEAWSKLNSGDLAALNKQLEAAHVAALPVGSGKSSPLVCVP